MHPLPSSLLGHGPPSLGMSPGPRRTRLFEGTTLCTWEPLSCTFILLNC